MTATPRILPPSAAHTTRWPSRLFSGTSGMGMRMRQIDWERTPLGTPEGWSHGFRTALGLCLGSRLCNCIYWGHQHLLLYNDAFGSILGTKHPWALLQPADLVWPEVFDLIGPLLDTTLNSGE